MHPSISADPVPLSRRQRHRQATLAEIKTLARRQLAEQGPGALSLRAIARQMGTASSALYRYFASQWWAICHAFRRWALEHPADFTLLFGTPQPGYQAPEQVTGPAAGRATQVPLRVYAAAVHAGAADLNRTQLPPTLELEVGELLVSLLGEAVGDTVGDTAADYPTRLTGIALNAYASVLGYLVAEIFGSLPRLIADTDRLYQAHVRTVMLGMGFDRVLVDAANSRHDG